MTATDAHTDAPADEGTDHDHEDSSAAQARKIAGYLIIAGCVLAAGCIGFIVWEQWRANKAVLEEFDGRVVDFPVGRVPGSPPPPRTRPQDGPGDPEGSASDEPGL